MSASARRSQRRNPLRVQARRPFTFHDTTRTRSGQARTARRRASAGGGRWSGGVSALESEVDIGLRGFAAESPFAQRQGIDAAARAPRLRAGDSTGASPIRGDLVSMAGAMPPTGRTRRAGAALALLLAVAAHQALAAARIDHEAQCTHKRLTWDDFRGPIVNGQQMAWISATIMLEPVLIDVREGEGGGAIARPRNPIVYAVMNKLDSGAQRGGRTDRSLAHEQIHFDLTEYLARRLTRELRAVEVRGEAASQELQRRLLLEVERLYSSTMAELQRLQDQYDGETVHGTRLGAQKRWAQRAAKLLESEPPYELR